VPVEMPRLLIPRAIQVEVADLLAVVDDFQREGILEEAVDVAIAYRAHALARTDALEERLEARHRRDRGAGPEERRARKSRERGSRERIVRDLARQIEAARFRGGGLQRLVEDLKLGVRRRFRLGEPLDSTRPELRDDEGVGQGTRRRGRAIAIELLFE